MAPDPVDTLVAATACTGLLASRYSCPLVRSCTLVYTTESSSTILTAAARQSFLLKVQTYPPLRTDPTLEKPVISPIRT